MTVRAPLLLLAAGFAGIGGCPTEDPTPPMVSAELGVTTDGAFQALGDNGAMPLFTALQGGSHMFVTIRTGGFPVESDGSAAIVLGEQVTVVSTGEVVHDFTQTVSFAALDGGRHELAERFVFLDALPDELDGATVRVVLTLTSESDARATTTVDQALLLNLQ